MRDSTALRESHGRVIEYGVRTGILRRCEPEGSAAVGIHAAHYRHLRATTDRLHRCYGRARLSHRGLRIHHPDRFAEIRHGLQVEPGAPISTPPRRTTAPLPRRRHHLAGAMWGPARRAAMSASRSLPTPEISISQLRAVPPGEEPVAAQAELKALMDKADQSVGGAAVGHRLAEYVAAGEAGIAPPAARRKSCEQEETWRSNTVIR
jgi:hypothetical protein